MAESRAFSNLVVVGSSAGGIDALSRLLGSLPADFPAPVVIAQHMHPDRESHLEDILSRASNLPVETVAEGAALAAGTVFVVPADRHASITEAQIQISTDGHGRPKPSIDLLMESASEIYGENLIAVVLSGSGSDGTDGARAVKTAGGTVIVQDPESAEFSGMPSSLAPNTVDIVSELDNIGAILCDLLSESAASGSAASGSAAAKTDDESELTEFLEELKQRHGVDFRDYKRPTIHRRLARRFAAVGVEDLARYRRYLEEHPEEYRQLVNTFLIKVTEFFRDPDQFGYLKDEVLPAIIERAQQSDEQIRIWSAGCATGEEAYSLAIMVSDALEAAADGGSARQDVRIFATDLDEGAVDHARRGIYPASALSTLSEEQVSRYFEEIDGLYYVRQPIRSMIIFGEHDLAQRSPFPRLDLVVSRNVLIYFTPELQRRTLQLFAFSLKDDGYLMLGNSESTSSLSEHFATVNREHNVFHRQGERFVMPVSSLAEAVPHPPRGPAHGRRSLRAPETFASQRSTRQNSQSATGSEEAALDRLPVGIVSVDRSYDIHSINTAARRLLSIHGQGIGEDLLHLVREAPYDELRAAIDSAFRDGEPSSTGEFDVEEVTTGEKRTLRMTCHPPADSARTEGQGSTRTAAIMVEDVTGSSQARRELQQSLDSTSAEFEEYRRKAQEDYERRREQNTRLVEANRQLEQTNREMRQEVEQLRSSNEQYQLSTEEAQASAEEVETLNEEMQATNEELETVNEEMQATVEELNTTNEDLTTRTSELQEMSRASDQEREQLKTILESIPQAMVVIEASGEPMFTNTAYRRTFPDGCVAQDDLGKDLPAEQTPRGRASRGETFTMELTAADSEGVKRRYEANGSPVGDRRRRGGVVVFREIA